MSDLLMFNCSHGKEDPERAILPFIAANVAATASQKVAVVCTIEAVWLGTEGGTAGIEKDGLPPLSQAYGELVGNGGEVWLCQTCTKPRGITEDRLAKGASIKGAAKVVRELVDGAKAINFA
jgi:predicted peroxiredoxin